MAINKNFVVKNGLEVSTDLILADATTRKVGIATTAIQYTLHVNGGIGATDLYVIGIGTFANELNVGLGGTVLTVLGVGNLIGVGTANPAFLLDVRSPVSTGQTALYVQGDIQVTGDVRADDIIIDDALIQDLTISNTFIVAGLSTFNSNVFINAALNVSGISTFGNYVDINNSVDVSNNLNVVGLTTLGGYVDINNSVDVSNNLNVTGISTFGNYVDVNNSVDISGTLNVVGLTTLGGYVDINNSVDVSGTLNVVGLTTLATVDINAGEVDVTRIGTGNLNVTGIATIATVDINAGEVDVTRIGTGNLNVTGIATIATVSIVGAALSSIIVTGISTLGTVRISSGIITATSGIVTYFGDGNFLNLTSNPSRGIGIGTTGGVVGYAVTFINFKGSGVSTAQYNSSTGIATIFFEGGGGGGGSISISTTAPLLPGSGDLWYSPDYGRTFIYYDESVVGYGTDAFWVDAAPFNVGIITSLSNVSFSPGSAVSPSMFFIGDNQTGFFSPGNGQFTVVSSGSSVLNVNASGINITGIATFTNASGTVKIGIGTTALLVEGNARVTGILTVGSSSITLNGASNIINVGTGLTLSSSGINVTGVITATSFVGNGSGLTGAGSTVFIDTTTNQEFFPLFTATTSGTITASGISTSKLKYNPSTGTVTATAFVGSGSGLTGAGSTVFIDTTTNQEFFPLFTATTSGTITASGISTSKLTYNPSTGAMTAVDFNSTSDISLKENIHTVGNALEITEQLRGVSFDWKETGRSSYGVIAQELEEVLPELVKQGEVKSVNYNGIIGVLIEAIKELKKEVEDLKRTK